MTPAPLTSQGWNGWTLDATRMTLTFPGQLEVKLANLGHATALLERLSELAEAAWVTDAALAGFVRAVDALLLVSLGTHISPMREDRLREAIEAWCRSHEGDR